MMENTYEITPFNFQEINTVQDAPKASLITDDQAEKARALADAEDAQVINGDEVRQMTLGKIDENILELQRLKKELRRK